MAQAKDMTDLIGLSNHMIISDVSGSVYTVLVNPASYRVNYSACYVEESTIATTNPALRFNRAKKQNMSLELERKDIELIWGKMHFKGVLSSVNITYSHFDATGNPIRATASCSFTGGDVVFEGLENENTFADTEQPAKVIDYSTVKHAINKAMLYGSYLSIIAEQAKETLPKSLRIKEEVAKMIIK